MHHLHSWIKIDQLDVTCFIVSLFNAQHVSRVRTSIFRSLRLIVDLYHGLHCSGSMCVGVTVWFGWGGVVSLCRLKHCFSLHKDIYIKPSIWTVATQAYYFKSGTVFEGCYIQSISMEFTHHSIGLCKVKLQKLRIFPSFLWNGYELFLLYYGLSWRTCTRTFIRPVVVTCTELGRWTEPTHICRTHDDDDDDDSTERFVLTTLRRYVIGTFFFVLEIAKCRSVTWIRNSIVCSSFTLNLLAPELFFF